MFKDGNQLEWKDIQDMRSNIWNIYNKKINKSLVWNAIERTIRLSIKDDWRKIRTLRIIYE